MNTEKITVQTIINTDIKRVWDYYTNPKHIINWNFADVSWHCPNAENNLQVGGKYRARMEAKDGSFGFDFWGIYTAIKPLELIEYKLGDERVASISFTKDDNGTKVVVIFEAENENPIEMQQFGWQSILNNFKKYAEQ